MCKRILSALLLISLVFQIAVPCYATEEDNADIINRMIIEHIVNEVENNDGNTTYTEFFVYDSQQHIIGRRKLIGNEEYIYTYVYNDNGTYEENIEVRQNENMAEDNLSEELLMDDVSNGSLEFKNDIMLFASSDYDSKIKSSELKNRIEQCQKIWNDANKSTTLTTTQKQAAKEEAHKQADIARADYCLVYPSSSFAYAFLPSGTLDTGTGFRRTIKPDMSNEFAFDVIAIQRALVAYGYIDSAEIPIDEYGYYGPTTQAAIREYQDATLGFNTGNVSTQTIAKLFNSNNKKQKEQSTFAMLSNINIYKGRHDAVCAAVEAQVKNRGFTTYREGFLYHAGLKELGGRFDVAGVSGSNKQVWEIKPDSAYGRLTGPLQVATYVAASNNADNLNHWNYRAYCPLSLGNDITSGTIAWKPGEQISYYSKGDIANKGVVYYNILKNLQPLFEPALSPYIVPKPNEDYARISMPSGETLKNGLITAGVTVVALFVIKEAVGLLLAPASGGASLILCF